MGPLFATVLAAALDSWWDELGQPDPFVVVEAGAGRGTLARDVLRAEPACAPALRYLLVERSEVQRARQADVLPLEPTDSALGPMEEDGDPDDGLRSVAGTGPAVASLSELPAGPLVGVILANELLDNLPFLLLERTGEGWSEVRVAEDDGQFVELLIAAAPDLAATAAALAPDAPVGGRIPLQRSAAAWLRATLALVRRGRVVTIDYADTSAGMATRPWTEWVRTYRGHGRGTHPLEDLGGQDVTCDVAVDQLSAVRPPDHDRSQADFLRSHGLEALREAAAAAWQERAHLGDLAAVRSRSRVHEADALTDPAGLGAFRVLEWVVPGRGR